MIINSLMILEKKLNFFSTVFAEQCSLPKNNSELPKNLLLLTEKRLGNVQISNGSIIKIINNLDLNKAYVHDMIRIRMLNKFQSTKKMINSASKTTDLSFCFRSAVRSLKDFYSTNCTSF